MKSGDKFKLTKDAIQHYGVQYAGKIFTVSHVARNHNDHPGYDSSMKGQRLYDAEELKFSVYDYEVRKIRTKTINQTNKQHEN